MSRRTTRYTLRKSNNLTYLTAQKQQSHWDADDKAQPPLRITVPAIKHRSPKFACTPDIDHQCWPIHGQIITVRFEIKKKRRRENTLGKTQWASSISLYLSFVSLYHQIMLQIWRGHLGMIQSQLHRMSTSLILCMKMIHNLIVDYVFSFVIDCDFSHVSAQLLELFN